MMYKQFWCKSFCVDLTIVDINTVDAITLDPNIVGLNNELVLDLNLWNLWSPYRLRLFFSGTNLTFLYFVSLQWSMITVTAVTVITDHCIS